MAVGSKPRCLWWRIGGGQERLVHWTKLGKGVNCEWDEGHVFMVEFTNDRKGGGSCRFVDSSQFALFVHLKMMICVGSDGLNNAVTCMMVWGWCGSCDGDIYADGIVGAAVVGGGRLVE